MRRFAAVGSLAVAVVLVGVAGMKPASSLAKASAGDDPITVKAASIGDPATAAPAPAPPEVPVPVVAPAPAPVEVVAMGDSVPSGDNCECESFVSNYVDLLGASTGAPVSLDNYAHGAATSASVRSDLRDAGLRRQLAAASTVVIMAGANDYIPAFRSVAAGTATAAIYQQVEDRVADNLSEVITTIKSLHTGPGAVHIAVLDYWNVMKDGDVASRVYNSRKRWAAARATVSANRAIARAIAGTDVTEVSTFTPFKTDSADITSLLAPDGDHPSAAGHRLIAEVLLQALPRG